MHILFCLLGKAEWKILVPKTLMNIPFLSGSRDFLHGYVYSLKASANGKARNHRLIIVSIYKYDVTISTSYNIRAGVCLRSRMHLTMITLDETYLINWMWAHCHSVITPMPQ